MKAKPGDVLIFKGVTWCEPHWEFDAPVIIYEPVQRYGFTGSVWEGAIEADIEDICLDLCINGEVRDSFSPDTLKEFAWRQWKIEDFPTMKDAIHLQITVRFFENMEGELEFEFLEREERTDGANNRETRNQTPETEK